MLKISRIQLMQALDLDFHVIFTLVLRVWSILAGMAMLVMLPLWLSPEQLGYHYTFLSLVGLQIFFDLGMNQVVTQITAHEMAHLKFTANGVLEGEGARLDRLTALTRLIRRWYFMASIGFILVASVAGVLFFSRDPSASHINWLWPWLMLCVATGLNLFLSPSLAMLEGAGLVGDVARIRLFQSIAGYSLMAFALVLGAGLWVSSVITLSAFVGSALWMKKNALMLRWLHQRAIQTHSSINWRKDIFPFQWRIAISWVSGYFIFQLLTPMIFKHQGAVEAGRFGMVLAVFNAIQSTGMSWVYSRSPRLAAAISRGEKSELHSIFLRALKPALGITTLACFFMVALVWALNDLGFHWAQRFSSVQVVISIALVTLVNAIIFAFAVFMRAFKEEPMMLPSLTLGVLTLVIAYFASRYSVELTASLYLAATFFIALPWSFKIFRRYWYYMPEKNSPAMNM